MKSWLFTGWRRTQCGLRCASEWQKFDALRPHDDLEWAAAEGEDLEEWECVICGKSFWSEAA
ncbi:hypothetical protein B0H14DRAFT_3740617, partial [Mycena olivaceomarginata]